MGLIGQVNVNYQEDDIIEIPNELYEEKVVLKNDLICGISYEDFEENEERIIYNKIKKIDFYYSWKNHNKQIIKWVDTLIQEI